eukprot:XP_008678006.1 protein FLORAL ORGAN NUMBER2-like [Zea mays]
MARIFLCMSLAAACCCFSIALLPPPAQGRPGLPAGGRINHLPEPTTEVPHVPFIVSVSLSPAAAAEQEQQQRGVQVRKTRPAWSPAAAAEGSVRPEMRAVPGGPDPLHHHGGSPSRRPAAGTHPVTRPAGQPAWLG